MKFDPEKHHRRSLRLKNRDYSLDGYYFVTICARNRENLFADLCVGARLALAPDPMHGLTLTAVGRIIEDNWHKIADQNVKTDAFIIMPNHIHGIIIIKSHYLRVGVGLAPTPASPVIDQGHPQGSTNYPLALVDIVCLPPQSGLPLPKNNAPAPNLGSIIGTFKSRCALEYLKFIDDNDLNESAKIWLRNYYEHIIRDHKELATIRNYIKANPANWTKDEENPLNIKRK